MSQFHPGSKALPYTHSFRVTLVHRGNTIEVMKAVRVAMRAPAPSTPSPTDGQTGHWVELRSDEGRLLYHRPFRNPLPDSVEVFDDPIDGSIRRAPTKRLEQKFDLIIPDNPDGAVLSLHGHPGKGRAPSSPLLKVTMDEVRQRSEAAAGRTPPDGSGAGGTEP